MQQTTKYQFNLIEGGDSFSPDPLNENMEKVENQLDALDTALTEGLAAAGTALTQTEQALTQADQTLSQNLAALAANLGAAGKNARIAWGTYTGAGTYGRSNPTSLTFDFYPVIVLIGSNSSNSTATNPAILLRNRMIARSDVRQNQDAYYSMSVSWADNGVSWFCSDGATGQSNVADRVYYYVAIGYDNTAEE